MAHNFCQEFGSSNGRGDNICNTFNNEDLSKEFRRSVGGSFWFGVSPEVGWVVLVWGVLRLPWDTAWGFNLLRKCLELEDPLPKTLLCGSLTWLRVGSGCWGLGSCPQGFLCVLMASSRVNIPREQGGGSTAFYDLVSELTQPHCHYMPLVTQANPDSTWEGPTQGH